MNDQKFLEWLEQDCACPAGFESGARVDVPAVFGEAYNEPLDVLHYDKPDYAGIIVRLAQFGSAAGLHALARRDARCFDLPPFEGDGRVCLIGAALEGYWRLSESFGGGEVLANQYADTVVALLAGGASRRVTQGISVWGSWPAVERVWRLCGVRLTGWASSSYEARCWAALDASEAAPEALAREIAEAVDAAMA